MATLQLSSTTAGEAQTWMCVIFFSGFGWNYPLEVLSCGLGTLLTVTICCLFAHLV